MAEPNAEPIWTIGPSRPTEEVLAAVSDDLNTPRAIAALHVLRAEARKGSSEAAGALKAGANLLGLLERTESEWKAETQSTAAIDAAKVETLIAARNAARTAKDFAEADRLRDEIVALGVVIMDGKDPATGAFVTNWEVKR